MENKINETAFRAKFDAVERLCKTPTDGADNTTTLADWMREGYWETMTAKAMAAEWDALSE